MLCGPIVLCNLKLTMAADLPRDRLIHLAGMKDIAGVEMRLDPSIQGRTCGHITPLSCGGGSG